MSSVPTDAAVAEIASQVEAISAVGTAVLLVFAALWAIRALRVALELMAGDAATQPAASFSSPGSGGGGGGSVAIESSLQQLDDGEYQRLAAVWQSWSDASQAGPGSGRQSIRLYDALVARGMDSEDAISAVEARNAAVARSDALAAAAEAAEHAAAVERYRDAPIDATVTLGGGWK